MKELQNKYSTRKNIRKGDVYYAELVGFGNQQIGTRPVVIYSNNVNNIFSPTLNVIPITTELKDLCVHVRIKGCGLKTESTALVEQITTINKTQLKNKRMEYNPQGLKKCEYYRSCNRGKSNELRNLKNEKI